MTKSKKNLGETTGESTGLAVFKATAPYLLMGGFGLMIWNKISGNADDKAKEEAEKSLNTPDGQIAQQLKSEFEKFGKIDAKKYTIIMQAVSPDRIPNIATIYKGLTGRRLTDDIGNEVSYETQQRTNKVAAWNLDAYSTVNVINDEIKTFVGKGDKIRFRPNQTEKIPVFKTVQGFHTGKIYKMLEPSRLAYSVKDVFQSPRESIVWKDRYDLIPFALPVRNRKVFVLAVINISSVKGKADMVYADLTKFITLKPHETVSGLGCDCQDNELSGISNFI